MSLIPRVHRVSWLPEPTWSDERVDRIFRDMFRDFFTGGPLLDRLFTGERAMLRIEEFVEDGVCVIRAELPGIDPEKDVEITVSDGVLHLEAHREERREDQRPDGYRSEFRYGSVERHIPLPEGATEKDVKASYQDGVLEVRVPIKAAPEAPAATKVPIEHKPHSHAG
jgi:HSP20 family protein